MTVLSSGLRGGWPADRPRPLSLAGADVEGRAQLPERESHYPLLGIDSPCGTFPFRLC